MTSIADKVKFIGLPSNIQPERYDVNLHVNLEENKFNGHEVVALRVYEPDSNESDHEIVFNSLNLELTNIALNIDGKKKVTPTETIIDKAAETCTLKFAEAVRGAEKVELSIDFAGILDDSLQGFYCSTYKDDEGKVHKVGVTQFEASDARRALPCWDEPSAKAVFKMTITAEAKYAILSNTSAVSEVISEDGVWKTAEFGETPKMSSYLLAYIIGEFGYLEGITKKGVRVRIYTRPEKVEFGKFSLRYALMFLDFYTDYFGIDYPLDKCDNIAIPDFGLGGMENWGLITYREMALICDEEHTSIPRKARIMDTIAHELSHQWFGNLVTMKWWDELWLNEGFATYMGYFTPEKFLPEWEFWNIYIRNEYSVALALDELESTHPIQVHVNTPSEINEIFDDISYSKGSTVVRMLASFIGETKFRDGLHLYLSRFKHKNTTTDDLWDALSETSGVDIKQMMDSWVRRPGFPLLKVSRASGKSISITQSRMLSSGKKGEDEELWWIPLTIASNDPQLNGKKVYFHDKVFTIEVENEFVDNLWVKVNVGQTSLVRVMYDPEFYETIKNAMNEISPIDKIGILDDATALSRAGYLDTSNLLTLLRSYQNETDFNVWCTISDTINTLLRALRVFPDLQKRFRAMVKGLATPLAAKLTWDAQPGESDQTTRHRSVMIELALSGEGGNGPFSEKVVQYFNNYLHDPSTFQATLRSTVFNYAARLSAEAWESLFEVYRDPKTTQDAKYNALLALGAPKEEEKLKRVFDWAIESGEVRKQDMAYPFVGGASSNPEFTERYAMENWDRICKEVNQGVFAALWNIVECTFGWAKRERLEDIRRFFETKDCSIFKRVLNNVYEKIEIRGRWRERMGTEIDAFFEKEEEEEAK